MKDIDDVIEKFRSHGLKITPQRICLFSLLQDNKTHPSAEEIYQDAKKIHPSISFTTVYKTLQTLRDLDEVREINVAPERAHYDPIIENHYHQFCTKCRSLKDYHPSVELNLPSPGRSDPGDFQVKSIQVHFIGVCEDCA